MNGGRGAGGGKVSFLDILEAYARGEGDRYDYSHQSIFIKNILLADENTKPKKRSRRQESQVQSITCFNLTIFHHY